MPPYSSLRTRRHFFFSTCTALLAAGLSGCAADGTGSHTPAFVVDGTFTEWSHHAATGDLNAVSDGRHLWIHLRLGTAPVSLQNLDAPWILEIDFDDVGLDDMRFVFSPADTGSGVGYETIQDGTPLTGSPYDVNFLFAPTIGSSEFEMRLDAPATAGGTVTMRTRPDDPPLQARIDSVPHRPAAVRAEQISHRPSGTLRVVSWNVLYGRLLHEPDRSTRILTTLDPDILLLQELEDGQSEQQVADFLNSALGRSPSPWNVVASPVGSRLRSMVAARGGVQVDDGRPIVQLDDPDRFLRAAIIGVPVPGHGMLLASSVHLRCCGAPGDEADMQRIAEAMSLSQAIDGIANSLEQRRRRLEQAMTTPAPTAIGIAGIIVGGDLNLVGSRVPLDVLTTDRRGDGALQAAELLQLDGSSNATWSDASSSFTPGRLDYLLYSPDRLIPTAGFILDTARLEPDQLTGLGLERSDTSVSDHAPLVLDLRLPPR